MNVIGLENPSRSPDLGEGAGGEVEGGGVRR